MDMKVKQTISAQLAELIVYAVCVSVNQSGINHPLHIPTKN